MSVLHIRAAVAQQEKQSQQNGAARTVAGGKGPYGLGLGVQGVQFGSTVVSAVATHYAYTE
jgi:hypothetical protein